MTGLLSKTFCVAAMAATLGACATAPAGTGAAAPAFSGGPEPQRATADAPAATPAQRSARVHVELGAAYMQSGRNGIALDEARAAIAADPSYAPGYELMGLVYADQEQFGLAAPAFEQASRMAPGDPVIANSSGWFLCSQGREAEGLARLEQAARNPYYATPTRAWTNAGLCLLRKKDYAGAEQRLMRAVQVDQANAQASVLLAELAMRDRRDLRAKQYIDQAMKFMPRANPAVLWLAVRIEQRLGNRATVDDLGARLRREFPGSNEYQNYLQGKFE